MIEIINLKMVRKGALVASFTVRLPKWSNFLIRDCSFFETEKARWVTFPSRQYEQEGKKKYFEFVMFEDRAINQQFKDKILEALDKLLAESMENVPVVQDDMPF